MKIYTVVSCSAGPPAFCRCRSSDPSIPPVKYSMLDARYFCVVVSTVPQSVHRKDKKQPEEWQVVLTMRSYFTYKYCSRTSPRDNSTTVARLFYAGFLGETVRAVESRIIPSLRRRSPPGLPKLAKEMSAGKRVTAKPPSRRRPRSVSALPVRLLYAAQERLGAWRRKFFVTGRLFFRFDCEPSTGVSTLVQEGCLALERHVGKALVRHVLRADGYYIMRYSKIGDGIGRGNARYCYGFTVGLHEEIYDGRFDPETFFFRGGGGGWRWSSPYL